MPEVLHLDVADDAVRTLAGPSPVLDPATAAVVERAVDAARRQAYAEGEAAGRAAAGAEVERAAAGVVAALGALHAELGEQRAVLTTASLELARAAAEAVLDAAPPPDALAVLDRVRAAAAGLDGDRFEVRVHPDDHVALDGTAAGDRLTLTPDPSLARGEARIVGAHGGAELTRAALVRAAVELLGGEAR